MTSLEKAINLGYLFLTFKPPKKSSIHAPLSSACIGVFQFIQKSVFDANTCTLNWAPITGTVDVHWVNFPIWGWNNSVWRYTSPHDATHDLMIVLQVDQSINQSDNYIMTLHYDHFNYSGLSWWPSLSETDVKTDVKSDPVDDTQYINNRSLQDIIN